ncbi:large conductance mechanosensitive channel protein MscL [Paenibacillus sp. N1-5-1-14]|uniref:large conductance mechanosensitive channel protein MscL n=1 Tax=Paenibacillus radicibacter TaxID=2972488 RepID=UPI0021597527|nr:large conductance mechanosensitive channel protein MscL [Paenibacillus radicibacter]MCR8642688.1 large conductance mechanosensitive channel protein MscL [Paenibacillus radicibacter]
MFKKFKDFAFKGNMIDLAIGVIIGGAFGKVVTSIVNDLVMPVIGLILGKVDFRSLYIALDGKHYDNLAKAQAAKAPTLNYGSLLSNLLDFLIIAFVIFLVLEQIVRFRKKEEAKPATTKECPACLSEVPIKATRCKYCTSQLEVQADKL